MRRHSEAAWERAMKAQEVILRAMAKRITWWQAAEIHKTSGSQGPPCCKPQSPYGLLRLAAKKNKNRTDRVL
jgi:hypothetical protein